MAKAKRRTKRPKRPMTNRVRTQRAIRFRNRGDSPLTPATQGKRDLLLELTRELQQLMIESMEGLGVSRKEQMVTYRRASRGDVPKERPSTRLMERTFAIADMLSSWRRDKRYVEPDGSPRVLPIKGKGASLETLAKRFVPTMSVSEVVTVITRHGEATTYRGDKVALVGGSVLLAPKTAEMTLASLVTRIRRVSHTLLLNASLPEGNKDGRFERQVHGVLSEREFNEYTRLMRTQLQDLCDRAESGLELMDKKGRKRKACGVTIFVFRDD
jgi:Family of unknown function (DUF6502)